MEFWAGAEVENSLASSLRKTRLALREQIVETLKQGLLAESDWEFCYVPIVMGPDFCDLYPARTKLDTQNKKLYHSPKLNFDTFRAGTDEQREQLYIEGILSVAKELNSIGLDDDQILQFQAGLKALLPSAE